jgi:hypothetical protein
VEGKKTGVNTSKTKILVLSYYWPPSGGSGVQRWMYFTKHLKLYGYHPIVITVDAAQASYPVFDPSLLAEVEEIEVIRTATREPLGWYSRLVSGTKRGAIPQGEVKTNSLFGKMAAYIRGNYFIPDARKGWVPFAFKAAKKLIQEHHIQYVITTGPPHSTHLVGLQLKQYFDFKWWVDFRDPWTELFYNASLYRTQRAIAKDKALEKTVLQKANGVITTVGGVLHEQLKTLAPQQTFVVLPNGYDAELITSVKATPPEGVFHVVYTGLLTENQEYKPVLEVLSKLQKKYPIQLSLAGQVAPELFLKIQKALPGVIVVNRGYLPHKEAVQLMKSAHLLLNFIFKGAQKQMISGKLLEYIATEIPILSIGDPDSEAGRFLMEGSYAKMLKAEQVSEMQYFIEFLLKENRALKNKFPALADWSRKAICKRLENEVLKS